jgi:hypothetical protein
VTFQPGREARWEYADQAVEAIERWNCSTGHGCVRGARKGSAEWRDYGPGGTCSLLADVFLEESVEEMDDDGKRVTCRAYVQRPDPALPVILAGQLTIEDVAP